MQERQRDFLNFFFSSPHVLQPEILAYIIRLNLIQIHTSRDLFYTLPYKGDNVNTDSDLS